MSESLNTVTWDYRIFKQEFQIGNDTFSAVFVVEASYNSEGKLIGVTSLDSPVAPYSMDLDGLREEFNLMAKAFKFPILTAKDLPITNTFMAEADGTEDLEEEDVE
jgi:hypothetical protein